MGAGLPLLRELDVSGTAVTGAAAAALSRCPLLTVLAAAGCEITDAHLAALALPALARGDFSGTRVTPAGARHCFPAAVLRLQRLRPPFAWMDPEPAQGPAAAVDAAPGAVPALPPWMMHLAAFAGQGHVLGNGDGAPPPA